MNEKSPDRGLELGALMGEHGSHIHGLIYRLLGNRETADDLTQEVFFKAFLGLDRYRPDHPIRAWLTRIARNTVIDHWRKKRIASLPLAQTDRESGLTRSVEVPFDGDSVAVVYERKELLDLSQRALGRLPAGLRELFLLKAYREMTYEEISALKGLPAATVKIRIFRARQNLRRILATRVLPGCGR